LKETAAPSAKALGLQIVFKLEGGMNRVWSYNCCDIYSFDL